MQAKNTKPIAVTMMNSCLIEFDQPQLSSHRGGGGIGAIKFSDTVTLSRTLDKITADAFTELKAMA